MAERGLLIIYGEAYQQRHQWFSSKKDDFEDIRQEDADHLQEVRILLNQREYSDLIPAQLRPWVEKTKGLITVRKGSVLVSFPGDIDGIDAERLLYSPDFENLMANVLSDGLFGGGIRFLSAWNNPSKRMEVSTKVELERAASSSKESRGVNNGKNWDFIPYTAGSDIGRAEEWNASVHRIVQKIFSGKASSWFAYKNKMFTFKRSDGTYRFSLMESKHNRAVLNSTTIRFRLLKPSNDYIYTAEDRGFFIMVWEEVDVQEVQTRVNQILARLQDIEKVEPTPIWEKDSVLLSVESAKDLSKAPSLKNLKLIQVDSFDDREQQLWRWLFESSPGSLNLESLFLAHVQYLKPELVVQILLDRTRFPKLHFVAFANCSNEEGISFEEIAEKIAYQCAGLPYAAKLIDLCSEDKKDIFSRMNAMSILDSAMMKVL